ncbi:MAG: hypothetical protein AAGA20_07795 [Planctomycetota bacterium]
MSVSLPALLLAIAAPEPAPAPAQDLVQPLPRSGRVALTPCRGSSARAGGGGATPVGPAVEQTPGRVVPPNSFDVSSFNYTDPNAPEFHPLGDTRFTAIRSDESLIIPATDFSYPAPRFEDFAGNLVGTSRIHHSAGGFSLQSAATGDVFGDGRELAVTVSRRSTGDLNRVNLRIWERSAQGDMAAIRSLETIYYSTGRVEIACADLDADGRDEVAIVALVGGTQRLFVFEDGLDASWTSGAAIAPVATVVLGTDAATLVEALEVDGDASRELATMSATSSTHDLRVFDDLLNGLQPLADTIVSAGSGSTTEGVYLRAIDHDGDGIDDLAHFSRESLRVARVDLATATLTAFGGSRTIQSSCPIALTVQDPEGLGEEQLAYLRTNYVPLPFGLNRVEYFLWRFRQDDAGGWATFPLYSGIGSSTNSPERQRPVECQMVALDDDRDGRQELQAIIGHQADGPNGPRVLRLAFDDSGSLRRFGPIGTFANYSLGARSFAFVAGDDDSETVTVRWSGQKELALSDPMPVVVMEAVPTKAGIDQNYAASGSSFTQGSSSSTSYATSTGVSLSTSVGVGNDSLFGTGLGAQAKLTLAATVERTTGVEEVVRTFTTYGSSSDVHSIVFQGTLHLVYVYEVVSAADPSAVGTLMSINVPVATDEWKWPLAFYNQVFPQAQIRPGAVFDHSAGATVIGDPGSYVRETELVGLVEGATPAFDGWVGGSSTVGLGGSFNGFGLSLSTVNATTDALTLSVEASTEFGVPGATFGASVGLSSGLVYTITTSTDTEYAATIGDIANSGTDYADWNYRTGMVVYQDRTTASKPFQVMRYWVEPLGAGY